jgi:2-iminobutanoate/2-iminopropanoate deaminase
MTYHQQVVTSAAPVPKLTYSQGRQAGDFIYTAGFGPHHPQSGEVVGTSIEEQTAQALLNVRAVLHAAGADMSSVIKVTVHLEDLAADFGGFEKAYRQFFTHPFPVRTTVGSRLPGILVEVDVVAYLPVPANARQSG